MPSTAFLAVYGALVSSFTLGWNIYRDFGDRTRLKVVARLRRLTRSAVSGQVFAVNPNLAVPGKSEQLFVFLDVTNVGRRPVRWDSWGGKYRDRVGGDDSFAFIPVGLPKMLNEGESHSEFTENLHSDIDNVKRIFISDAADKKWYLPRRALRKLKKEIQKERSAAG